MGVDIHCVFQRRTPAGWEDVETHYDERRDYYLFAWLGGERNGHDATLVPPLSKNRGYPADFVTSGDDKYDGRWYKGKDMGERNRSWLHVDEILRAVPPCRLRSGVVEKAFYDQWDGITPPAAGEYAGDVADGLGGVVKRHPSDVCEKTTHVRVEWFEDGAESLKYFIDEVRRLREKFGDIRLVFGFDG